MNRRNSKSVAGAGVAALAFLFVAMINGCSLSESSESISKSISSPFASSSASSSPEDAYRADVRDYTAAHIQSGGSVDDLRRRIAELAADNGITDWERSEATYRGVGEGLAKGGYRQIQVDAFKQNFADSEEQAKWLQKGYDSAR